MPQLYKGSLSWVSTAVGPTGFEVLRLALDALESHDLGEDLIVEPLQCFSLAGGVPMIGSRLYLFAIG